jgi:hypothetical protein
MKAFRFNHLFMHSYQWIVGMMHYVSFSLYKMGSDVISL